MKRLQSTLTFFTVLLLAPCFVVAQANLGSIDFPVSGKADAIASFEDGVLLLHSFEYEDAASAFAEARKKDPEMVMAYWGEAMTKNHPVWNRQDRDAAQSILQKLAPTSILRAEKAQTEREGDYLQTVEVLFGEGSKEERDDLYETAMANLASKYPDDLEAKTFYALSVLGSCQGKRDFRKYMKAGAIAREAYDKNPNHPGAAHYVIHSFDDPIHAPLGLEAAESYASIAPDAAHANHMPSHIFMALGLWKESNATNVRSKMAAMSKGRHGLHARWWLTYGYLQSGQIDLAKAEILELSEIAKTDESRSVHTHLAYVIAHFLHEYGAELDRVHMDRINMDQVSGSAEANLLLSLALWHWESEEGSKDESEKVLNRLEEIKTAEGQYVNPDEIAIMQHQLRALDLLTESMHDEAFAELDMALEIHERMAVEFGPPSPVKPLHEFYADLALEAGDLPKAKKLYEQAMLDKPGRWQAVRGLAEISKKMEDVSGTLQHSCYLAELLEHADERFSDINSTCIEE